MYSTLCMEQIDTSDLGENDNAAMCLQFDSQQHLKWFQFKAGLKFMKGGVE